ncbi:hypothetical protein ONS95_014974 [Cadophora gregata]|uniref:uncharacterized protein n=1 Tax=Cadophora gregata TaxID=51156 RepID=UPI0026DC114E|nr:uncharacterized protein ONS95_014974 [Cadophora gregata]KAK0103177.1 hypothetical protein ONS96_005783 [Cadophora gregata f. sp. sojae]KAK0113280.1 hypothetical protein ONS95_014974 [Cadophora gregata]
MAPHSESPNGAETSHSFRVKEPQISVINDFPIEKSVFPSAAAALSAEANGMPDVLLGNKETSKSSAKVQRNMIELLPNQLATVAHKDAQVHHFPISDVAQPISCSEIGDPEPVIHEPSQSSDNKLRNALYHQTQDYFQPFDIGRVEKTSRKPQHESTQVSYSAQLQAEVQPKSKPRAPLRTIFPALKIEDYPIDQPAPLKAIVVGAGISGINVGILLPIKIPGLELVIYEKACDLGGTWNSNIYPGVKCDVPADVYQSTFSPSLDWSTTYAAGAEIKDYWKRVAEKYDVLKYITFNSLITHAEWNDGRSKWIVHVTTNGIDSTEETDFLITATGHFSQPLLPNYPGLEEYEGHLRHSSNWDPDFDPTDKRVALIGNGASGLQIVPPLQKAVKHLDHYARSKTWIAGSFGGEDMTNFRPDEARDPARFHEYRKKLEAKSFNRFGGILRDSKKSLELRSNFEKLMAQRLGDRKELLDSIIPEFSPSCRRLTPGPGYLEALTKENVSYISTKIERITKTGIQTSDGVHREVDAIICSTGADISFSTAFPIVAHNINLQTAWRPGGDPGFPDSYLSIAAPNFPNLFLLVGPNATGPGGTFPNAVENQVTYIAKVLRKVKTQRIRTITPTQAATNDFRAYCESFFPRTVMSENCSSWYNGGIAGGRIHGLWPGSGTHANIVRRDPRWEDFDYTYRSGSGNRFAYFGNGYSVIDAQAENDPDAKVDFTPYLTREAAEGKVDLRAYNELWFDAGTEWDSQKYISA